MARARAKPRDYRFQRQHSEVGPARPRPGPVTHPRNFVRRDGSNVRQFNLHEKDPSISLSIAGILAHGCQKLARPPFWAIHELGNGAFPEAAPEKLMTFRPCATINARGSSMGGWMPVFSAELMVVMPPSARAARFWKVSPTTPAPRPGMGAFAFAGGPPSAFAFAFNCANVPYFALASGRHLAAMIKQALHKIVVQSLDSSVNVGLSRDRQID